MHLQGPQGWPYDQLVNLLRIARYEAQTPNFEESLVPMVRLDDIAQQHRSLWACLTAVVLLFSAGCRHDAELVTPAPPPQPPPGPTGDYRLSYCGDFRFTVDGYGYSVEYENGVFTPNVWTDTSVFDGTIRIYDQDSVPYWHLTPSSVIAPPDSFVTVNFLEGRCFSGQLAEDGVLVERLIPQYSHSGHYVTADSVHFYVSNGGVAQYRRYIISGVRL